MVKEPRPGRVKTRLAHDIGRIAAVWWFRQQVARLLRTLRDPRWRIVLAVAPDQSVGARVWPPDLVRCPQGRGDLGVRMRRQLNAVSGPVCLIGADVPGISAKHVARAFRALRSADAVFGPAEDGGYWLIGCRAGRRLPLAALQGVRWSGPHALQDSLSGLTGWRVSKVATLRDVDTGADLVAVAEFAGDVAQHPC